MYQVYTTATYPVPRRCPVVVMTNITPISLFGPKGQLTAYSPAYHTYERMEDGEEQNNEATKQQKNEKDDDVNETKKEILKQI